MTTPSPLAPPDQDSDLLNAAQAPAPEQDNADASPDNPDDSSEQDAIDASQLDQPLIDGLKQVRDIFTKQYAPARGPYIRRVLRAIEVMKNNPYILFNGNSTAYDTLDEIFQGQDPNVDDDELYQYSDNIYQMLALACIAALSPAVPKCRFMPTDAENEEDLMIAQKASTIHAYNERKNNIGSLLKLEILQLWLSGSYFAYTRHIIDANRAGVQKIPQYELQAQQIMPERYVCPGCGTASPAEGFSPFAQASCPECSRPLGQGDWYESESANLPAKVGDQEVPNGMTAMNVLNGLNVSVNPDAQDLYETEILDYQVELNIAAVRASYPARYSDIRAGGSGSSGSAGDDEEAKRARQSVTAPGGASATSNGANQGTYSRCWIQPWAFNILDDKSVADQLTEKFPKGCKLVMFNNLFLQAVPERLMDKWTWCPTIKGLGMYPFGIGDAALDIQERINDCANTVHAYMDRIAFGTALADGDVLDIEAMTSKAFTPGNFTAVNRKGDAEGQSKALSELIFQPEFHIDSHIFQYGQQLIQLAQMIAGVQPQVFGGSDPNVQTASGQQQMLKTAMGRMQLYWDQIREEHAARAENSVRCTVENMDEQMRVVMDGELEGNYKTEVILASEVVGDFMAYPESDEGFPSTYEEVQSRIMQLLQNAQKNEWLMTVLAEPDTQKVVARYILPDGIDLPGDEERSRLKELMTMLAKGQPVVAPGPPGPNGPGAQVLIPSILPSDDFDDMAMGVEIATKWLQVNWKGADSPGFANVLAFARICKQKQQAAAIKQQAMQQQAQQGPPMPGGKPAAPQPSA